MSLSNFDPKFPSQPDRTEGGITNTYFDRQWTYLVTFVQSVSAKINELVKAINSIPAPPVTPTGVLFTRSANLAGSRAWGTVYGPATTPLLISGYGDNGGSAVGNFACKVGTTNPPTVTIWANEFTATVGGEHSAFAFSVAKGEYYQVNATGDISGSPTGWYETAVTLS